MSFENIPMQWDNEGAAPSADLSSEGYKAGAYPAADTFNYFFNNSTKCITELQEEVETTQSDVAEIQKTHNVVNRYSLTLTDDFKSATEDRSNYVIEVNGIATLYMRFTMTNAGTLSGNWTIATLPSGMHPAKGGGTALDYANNFIQGTGCVSGLTIEGTENDEGTHNVVIWPWGSNDRTYEANEVFLLYIQFPVEYDKE